MRELLRLMHEGAREICTPAEACQLRTVVQWDGDVMTFATEAALEQQALVEQHFQQVGRCFRAFSGVRRSLQALSGLGVAAPVALVIHAWNQPDPAVGELVRLAAPYVSGSLFCFAAPTLLRWYLRRAWG